MTWSTSLQKEAEDWVRYLAENNKFHKSSRNPGNLYMSVYKPKEYCSDAIWWFHWQGKSYDYDNPGYRKTTEHFTQVKQEYCHGLTLICFVCNLSQLSRNI